MYKFKSLLLIGLVMAVAACGGQAPTTPVAPPTAVVAVPPTTTAAAPAQPGAGLSVTPAGVSSPPTLDPAGMCKAIGAPQPTPNFPATLPTDQSKGSANAPMTLYEYSDFQ